MIEVEWTAKLVNNGEVMNEYAGKVETDTYLLLGRVSQTVGEQLFNQIVASQMPKTEPTEEVFVNPSPLEFLHCHQIDVEKLVEELPVTTPKETKKVQRKK